MAKTITAFEVETFKSLMLKVLFGAAQWVLSRALPTWVNITYYINAVKIFRSKDIIKYLWIDTESLLFILSIICLLTAMKLI